MEVGWREGSLSPPYKGRRSGITSKEYLHKAIAPKPSGRDQGLSQKAIVIVVPTITKKRSPDASPTRSSRNPHLL